MSINYSVINDLKLDKKKIFSELIYSVYYFNQENKGFVDVVLRDRDDFLEGSNLLETVELSKGDIVAEIDSFYPHGTDNPNKNSRKGIGSSILELISEDLLKENTKGIYIYAPSNSMRNFILKKGFQDLGYSEYFRFIK